MRGLPLDLLQSKVFPYLHCQDIKPLEKIWDLTWPTTWKLYHDEVFGPIGLACDHPCYSDLRYPLSDQHRRELWERISTVKQDPLTISSSAFSLVSQRCPENNGAPLPTSLVSIGGGYFPQSLALSAPSGDRFWAAFEAVDENELWDLELRIWRRPDVEISEILDSGGLLFSSRKQGVKLLSSDLTFRLRTSVSSQSSSSAASSGGEWLDLLVGGERLALRPFASCRVRCQCESLECAAKDDTSSLRLPFFLGRSSPWCSPLFLDFVRLIPRAITPPKALISVSPARALGPIWRRTEINTITRDSFDGLLGTELPNLDETNGTFLRLEVSVPAQLLTRNLMVSWRGPQIAVTSCKHRWTKPMCASSIEGADFKNAPLAVLNVTQSCAMNSVGDYTPWQASWTQKAFSVGNLIYVPPERNGETFVFWCIKGRNEVSNPQLQYRLLSKDFYGDNCFKSNNHNQRKRRLRRDAIDVHPEAKCLKYFSTSALAHSDRLCASTEPLESGWWEFRWTSVPADLLGVSYGGCYTLSETSLTDRYDEKHSLTEEVLQRVHTISNSNSNLMMREATNTTTIEDRILEVQAFVVSSRLTEWSLFVVE